MGFGSTSVNLENAAVIAEDCRLLCPLATSDADTQLDADFVIVSQVTCDSGLVPGMVISAVDTALGEVEWFAKRFVGPKSGACRTEMCASLTQRLTAIMGVLTPMGDVQVRGGDIFKSMKRLYDLDQASKLSSDLLM